MATTNKNYQVKYGDESNTCKGDRFQSMVKRKLLKKYRNKIDFFAEEYYIDIICLTIDFFIILKNGKYLFVEAKYRNGDGGKKKGLSKDEATHSALNSAVMVNLYTKIENIEKYAFQIYTNDIPTENKASHRWLSIHVNLYKTIHDIYVVENCEEEVENLKVTSSLENFFHG